MTVKSFGSLLIGIGVFVAFMLFAFSEWRVDLDFIQNIRYATLYETVRSLDSYGNWHEPVIITLGQGLLLPFSVIGIGLVLNREFFDSNKVAELLPFLMGNTKP